MDLGRKKILTSRIQCLPREIIFDILSRLPVTSLLQIKLVCRAWHSIAKDPDLIPMHSSRSDASDPFLLLHSDYSIENELYLVEIPAHNRENGMVKKISMPTLPKFNVVCTCNGVLCLVGELLAIYLYNPFTSTYKEIPKTILCFTHMFRFGFHPVIMEYKVITIVATAQRMSINSRRWISSGSDVKILTLGSSTWRRLGLIPYYFIQPSSQVLISGRLHWVATACGRSTIRLIVSFDISDEQFREVLKPVCGGLDKCRYQLVALRGCLSAVECCDDAKLKIWVMKEYDVEGSWTIQFNIGAYLPKGLEVDVDSFFKDSKFYLRRSCVRVLGILRKGEILLEYKCRALVCYDPKTETFTDLDIQGMPNWFQTIVHVGSLNQIDT